MRSRKKEELRSHQVVYLREVVKRLAAIKLEPAKPNAAPLWHLPDYAPKDGADDESTYVDSDSVGWAM